MGWMESTWPLNASCTQLCPGVQESRGVGYYALWCGSTIQEQLLYINAAVPRRARIQGSQTFVSLNSRLESNKDEKKNWSQHQTLELGRRRTICPANTNLILTSIHHKYNFPRVTDSWWQRGKRLFINSQTRPFHAKEGNQTKRKGTSPWPPRRVDLLAQMIIIGWEG